jgi:NADPH:quinone reductase-like Zn-dependent oxidoreductase
VRGFKVGDRVYAYNLTNPKRGFYAEYVAMAAKDVGHVPTMRFSTPSTTCCRGSVTTP